MRGRGARKPEVSVIIPALNEEKYIGAALASLERQRFEGKYEIIVGDGNSTDRTREIAKSYGARVVVENYGTPAGGRHAAAMVARGKYLLFTGADVEVSPDWMRLMVDALKKRGVSGALGSVAPLEGTLLEEFLVWWLRPLAVIMNGIGLVYAYGESMACTAETYRKTGGFNPKLVTGEDTDFAMRLAKAGKFVFVWNATVKVSMRRPRSWGYVRYALFHIGNFIRSHFFDAPSRRYEPVR
ncbi:MAG: glycosyltransferase [Candidatus Micrarchaeota archaeon]|nr:glycosyltransferase [Candidatus Micrarchaeota archaeon]